MKVKVGSYEIEIRGLKRGEIKRLNAEGVNFEKIMELELDERDLQMEKIFQIAVLEGPDLDELTPAEAMELFIEIGKATYLGEGQLKNFVESQDFGSGGSFTPATNAKKKASKRRGGAQK